LRWITMKRDMDLIRLILLELEKVANGLGSTKIKLDGFSAEEIGYHSQLLVEAGFVIGINLTHNRSEHPEYMLNKLTWEGHDFLDACRDNTRWGKAKEIASKAGGVTLNMMKDILVQLTTATISEIIKHA